LNICFGEFPEKKEEERIILGMILKYFLLFLSSAPLKIQRMIKTQNKSKKEIIELIAISQKYPNEGQQNVR